MTTGCSLLNKKAGNDEQLLIDAVKNVDTRLCSKIKDIELLERCNLETKDESSKINALNSQDLSYCDQISTMAKQGECKVLYANQEKHIDQTQILYEAHQKVLKIIKKGQIEDCYTVADDLFKNECVINVYINEAQKRKDPSICRKIENKSFAKACIESLNIL